jgi:CysZ protein
MLDFLRGLRFLLGGFRLIISPGIRRYVFIPLAINILLFSLGIGYGFHLLQWLVDGWLPGWLSWLEWLLWPLAAALAFGIVYFGFSLVANLIGAPFNTLLASAVEAKLRGLPLGGESPPAISLPREVFNTLRSLAGKLLYAMLGLIPLLAVYLIPGGQLLAPVATSAFLAWTLALEYSEYPMGNHGLGFKEQRQLLARKRMAALGFGAGVMLLTLIPFANFIVMPVSVAGATLLWVERFQDLRIKS